MRIHSQAVWCSSLYYFCSNRVGLRKGISTESQKISRLETHFLLKALAIIVDFADLRDFGTRLGITNFKRGNSALDVDCWTALVARAAAARFWHKASNIVLGPISQTGHWSKAPCGGSSQSSASTARTASSPGDLALGPVGTCPRLDTKPEKSEFQAGFPACLQGWTAKASKEPI